MAERDGSAGRRAFRCIRRSLGRVNILEDDHGCDLIVTAHHAILDGMGALRLIRDVLAVLSGERLAPLAMPLAAEDRIEEARSSAPPQSIMDPQAAEAWQQFLATRPPRSFERHAGTRRPIISSLRLFPLKRPANCSALLASNKPRLALCC